MKKSLVLALIVFATACAHTQNEQTEYNSSVITEAEITSSGSQTAYDAIKKLRANYLASRGRTSLQGDAQIPEPNVWLDGQFFGPLAALKSIPANQVGMIRMYRSWEVQSKFGPNNLGGVIEITTRR